MHIYVMQANEFWAFFLFTRIFLLKHGAKACFTWPMVNRINNVVVLDILLVLVDQEAHLV